MKRKANQWFHEWVRFLMRAKRRWTASSINLQIGLNIQPWNLIFPLNWRSVCKKKPEENLGKNINFLHNLIGYACPAITWGDLDKLCWTLGFSFMRNHPNRSKALSDWGKKELDFLYKPVTYRLKKGLWFQIYQQHLRSSPSVSQLRLSDPSSIAHSTQLTTDPVITTQALITTVLLARRIATLKHQLKVLPCTKPWQKKRVQPFSVCFNNSCFKTKSCVIAHEFLVILSRNKGVPQGSVL